MKFRIPVLLSLFAVFSISGPAQTFRGGINGTVQDASGAAVAGVAVQALNAATGLKRDTATTSAGEFTFQDLPLGTYEVVVTQAGFDKLKLEQVAVEVGKNTTLRLTLKVAAQSQTVEVRGSAVTIDTETSTLNEVIPNKAVQDMPLNGRDFTQLIKLRAGRQRRGLNQRRAHRAEQLADRRRGQQRRLAQFRRGQSGRRFGRCRDAAADRRHRSVFGAEQRQRRSGAQWRRFDQHGDQVGHQCAARSAVLLQPQ